MTTPLASRALYPKVGWPAHQPFFIKIVKSVPILTPTSPLPHNTLKPVPQCDFEMGLDLSLADPSQQSYTQSRFYKRIGKYNILRPQDHEDGMMHLIYVFKATLPEGKWRCRVWEEDGVEQVLGDIDIVFTGGDVGIYEVEKRDIFQIAFQRELSAEFDYFYDELHDDGTRYFPDFRRVPQGFMSSKL